MNALQKEVESWAEKAPPTSKLADEYARAITKLQENPNNKNIILAEQLAAALIAKVMYDNGYVSVFEHDQLVGYAPKDLNELN